MSFKTNNYVVTATDSYDLSKEPIADVFPLTENIVGCFPWCVVCVWHHESQHVYQLDNVLPVEQTSKVWGTVPCRDPENST